MRPSELFNPENPTDITKLGLESTEIEPKFEFDPKKDLTEEDWKTMNWVRHNTMSDNEGPACAEIILLMHELDPERNAVLDEREKEFMYAWYEINLKSIEIWSMPKFLRIGRELLQPGDREMKLVNWEKLERERSRQSTLRDRDTFFKMSIDMRKLDSENEVKINKEDLLGLENKRQEAAEKENWPEFARLTCTIYELQPNYSIEVTGEQFRKIENSWKSLRTATNFFGKYWFVILSRCMQLLSQMEAQHKSVDRLHERPLPEVKSF